MFDLEEEDKRFTVAVGGGCIMIWPSPPQLSGAKGTGQEDDAVQVRRTGADHLSVGLLNRFKIALARWMQ